MIQQKLTINFQETSHRYEIKIGDDLLDLCGEWARSSTADTARKIVIVSNAKIFRLYGKKVENSLKKAGFETYIFLMKDGERFKNLQSLEKLLAFFSENRLTRNDSVIALGGGVVGDLTGFAAAVFLRGIRFLQIPTTLLAMIDSSVGGKTGVNSAFGKNLIGAFHQPSGVLVDLAVLKTLESREITAGFCEAVKHGAISSKELFHQTADFLRKYHSEKFNNCFSDESFRLEFANLIAHQIAFKAQIVAQDERENSLRIDAKSRKILNFGHTVAHALEKVTNYKYFKHGEAVGYGMLCAGEISKSIGIFDKNELKLLNDVVGFVGKLPPTENIEIEKLIEAFDFDKKSDGKNLQWILLEGIGKPIILTNEKIPFRIIRNSLHKILKQ